MTTTRPTPSPGYCSRCEHEVPDAILVTVIERGTGPAVGNMACMAHARELAAQAPQFMDPEVARALRRRP